MQLVQSFGGCIDTVVSRIGVSNPSWGLVITQPDCASGANTAPLSWFCRIVRYQYRMVSWSYSNRPTKLTSGTYSLTLTDSISPNISCSIDTTFDIVDAGSLTYTVTTDTIDCGATDGLGTISGLLPNTNYIIGYSQNGTLVQSPIGTVSDGGGIIVLSNLTGGNLVITIEDPATGCFDTTTTNVEQT